MRGKTVSPAQNLWRWLLWLLTTLAVVSSTAVAQGQSAAAGSWSGLFSSQNFASFPVSLSITQDVHGNLTGNASIVHPCISDSTLIVTVVGTSIVLGGSDAEGDTITFRGTIDPTGKLLDLSFLINGSPSARCETDQGKGSMTKH